MAYPTPAPTKTPVSCFSAADAATEPFSSDEVKCSVYYKNIDIYKNNLMYIFNIIIIS